MPDDINDLQFVRTFDFALIPRTLLEQVKEIDSEEIDRIYTFGPMFASNPLTLLYALVDAGYKIKGVLWAEIDVIDAIIFIRLLSVNKEYQSQNGQLLNKAKDWLFNLKTGPKLKKEIHFLTTRPGAFEKIGVRRSKRIRMEITNENSQSHTKRDNTSDTSKPTK
ncbi:unnamed protein product [marine sediment metagenome]|uniref:Uncharacterized protein n=1 Tax=marine sediment metagenome TaxID=412755 RepID=X0T5D1_9ZZZZ